MEIIRTSKTITDQERAEILFRGDLLIQTDIKAMHQVIVWTRDLLDQTLPINATKIQASLDPKAFLKHTAKAQESFRKSEAIRKHFFGALVECGVDIQHTYYDHFPLRIVPSGDEYGGARNSSISHHRDTWGSCIHSQINWWAPIFELEKSRTIAIYPDYWTHPLANNTQQWRFEKHIESRRITPKGMQAPYPSAPSPTEAVNESNMIPVMLNPGDILSFSSAHLHASVPNTSSFTRYSVEMRTINLADLQQNRMAPNVDNQGERPMYQWFKRITDKQSLQAEIGTGDRS